MDVTQAAVRNTATPANTAPPPADSAGTTLTSDFETFLKMLTVQMENQDPLNPIDSSDYAVQLATFSGVEQQVLTNDLLRSLGASGSMGGLAEHAAWVGMQARVEGPVAFDGTPVEIHYDLPLDATTAELVVYDTSGLEIHRRPLAGPGPLDWDGLSPSGATLLAGTYSLSVEAKTAVGQTKTVPVSSYARVTEVQTGAEGPMVALDNGQLVAATDITALRQ